MNYERAGNIFSMFAGNILGVWIGQTHSMGEGFIIALIAWGIALVLTCRKGE